MDNPEVGQLCVSELVTLFGEHDSERNSKNIEQAVEKAYNRLRLAAVVSNKVVVNATQTISTECLQVIDNLPQIIYIITLVGTVVDAELIKRQQMRDQLGSALVDPRFRRSN